MLRKLIGNSLQSLKLSPLPRNNFGVFVRTFKENRAGEVRCTSKSCQKQNVLKIARKTSCRPIGPYKIRPFSVCDRPEEDPCNPKAPCCGHDRLKKDPCYKKRTPKKIKLDLHKDLPKKSVWEYTPDCCGNPCPEMMPRFDTLYYRMKDKRKMKYQQTWVECPYRRKPKRRTCLYIEKMPPLYRRKVPKPYVSACPFETLKLKELCCLGSSRGCSRIKMPGCLFARVPPDCHLFPGPSGCQKKCCPYPSFSECCRKCVPRLPKRECKCVRFRMECESNKVLRRKRIYDLPPTLPEWPPSLRGPRY